MSACNSSQGVARIVNPVRTTGLAHPNIVSASFSYQASGTSSEGASNWPSSAACCAASVATACACGDSGDTRNCNRGTTTSGDIHGYASA